MHTTHLRKVGGSVMLAVPPALLKLLNLQAGANVLVWLSLDWSLERVQQFEARIYRQGQKKKVFIYTIAAQGTIDEAVAKSLTEKKQGQDSLIAALKTYVKGK